MPDFLENMTIPSALPYPHCTEIYMGIGKKTESFGQAYNVII